MDPRQQQINQLDPKLKEAYEKVMGTGNPPINPAAAPLQASAKADMPSLQTGSTPPPITPNSPPPQPNSISFQPKPMQGTPVGSSSPSPSHGFVAKKRSSVSPVIIVLGIIVFLLVYTLFWIKFFNIKVPFLP